TGAPTDGGYIAIAAGYFHSLALTADGRITSWGNTQFGQATGVPADGGYTAIAAGSSHSLALTADGHVTTWGSAGQATGAPTDGGYTAIAAGAGHSLALNPRTAPAFTDTTPVTLNAVTGTALTREFTVTGYPTPAVAVLDETTLPTGMTFTNNTLTGTPTAAGTYTFTLTASNGVGTDLTLDVTVNVTDPPVTPGSGSLGFLGQIFGS
ncbi:putative Ig domain-containing protein, partial [Rhodococcus sp. IEGM 1379]|uniref:putative Ig domain-containing protein n=1 Tax=Rhodococcus sp. IEGM 1379 TaxID=3047086 RepID=UPI0024B6A86B